MLQYEDAKMAECIKFTFCRIFSIQILPKPQKIIFAGRQTLKCLNNINLKTCLMNRNVCNSEIANLQEGLKRPQYEQ